MHTDAHTHTHTQNITSRDALNFNATAIAGKYEIKRRQASWIRHLAWMILQDHKEHGFSVWQHLMIQSCGGERMNMPQRQTYVKWRRIASYAAESKSKSIRSVQTSTFALLQSLFPLHPIDLWCSHKWCHDIMHTAPIWWMPCYHLQLSLLETAISSFISPHLSFNVKSRWPLALALLTEMSKKLQPDIVSFSALISTLPKEDSAFPPNSHPHKSW